MKKKFKIDFFEFSFLVEATIPPRPIARSMFWDEVINDYYHQLTPNERERLYTWINRNSYYEDGLRNKDEQCLMFEARFDPENQYLVKTKYEGEEGEHECFKFNDRYYVGKSRFLEDKYIVNVKKL